MYTDNPEKQSLVKTFHIDFHSRVTNQKYTGVFTTKKLDIAAMVNMGVIKTQILQGYGYNPQNGMGVSFEIELLASMRALCEAALISRPEWFKDIGALHDVKLLEAVFEEVNSFEASFRDPNTGNNDGRGERGVSANEGASQQSQDGGEAQSSSQQSGIVKTVVGEQVPKITKVG